MSKSFATPPRRSMSRTSSLASPTNAIDDDTDPFSPDFQPASLKVAQLRSLLLQHGVSLPSTARKQALVDAYEAHIRPRASELRAQRNRDLNARPDGRGVLHYGSLTRVKSPLSGGEGDDQAVDTGSESEGAAGVPRSALSRRSTPGSRRSVSFAASVSGGSDDERDPDNSNFSEQNPFQSVKEEEKSGRVSSRGAVRQEKAKKSARSAASPEIKAGKGQSRRGKAAVKDESNGEVSSLSSLRNYMDPVIAASTPPRVMGAVKRQVDQGIAKLSSNEQEVEGDAEDEAETKSITNGEARPRKPRKTSKQTQEDRLSSIRSTLWFVLHSVTMVWWAWYVRESREVGFCDTGSSSNVFLAQRAAVEAKKAAQRNTGDEDVDLSVSVPQFLRPTCTPCAPHAICRSGKLVSCESSDYVLSHSFISNIPLVHQLLPLSSSSPVCLPDTQKVLLAAEVAEELEVRLRHWKADVLCKRADPHSRAKSVSKGSGGDTLFALPRNELEDALRDDVKQGGLLADQADEYFDELWKLAFEDVTTNGRVNVIGNEGLLVAVKGPLGVGASCQAKLAGQSLWRRARMWLALVTILVGGVQFLRARFAKTQDTAKKVHELVKVAIEELQAQAKAEPPFLSSAQLRDSVLRDEHNVAKREQLWRRVSKIVEGNANVRTREAKVSGEYARVWQWL